MGCCLGCLACEAASCACSGICSCFGKAVPVTLIAGRIMYTVVFFLMSFVAWIFHGWSKQLLENIPVLQRCAQTEDETGDQIMCYGTLAVYRISFILAVFHLILALFMIGVKTKGDFRTGIQDGWWLIKLLFLVGGSVGAFFIPNPFFEWFGWVAFVASAFFIIVQLLLLVDFAHNWAESWIGKLEESDEDDRRWFWLLMGATGALYIFSLVLTIIMAVFFARDAADCQKNVAFITLNSVLCFLLSIMSVHPKVQEFSPKSGLLQSSVITAYSTYLVFSAMMSSTDSCNPWVQSSTGSNVSVAIGAVFTIIAVCYTTVRAASQVGEIEEHAPLMRAEEGEGEKSDVKAALASTEADATNSDPDEPVGYSFSKFHIVFALGAFYISMLMSDWRTVYNPGESTATVDSGLAAMWVKIVSGWGCIAIYIWTLMAPVLLPDREWS